MGTPYSFGGEASDGKEKALVSGASVVLLIDIQGWSFCAA
jgi:hypothetical protein